MEKIVWDESFSVGVAVLDEQHKQIIGMIDLLLPSPAEETIDVRSEAISEVLGRLVKYAPRAFQDGGGTPGATWLL